MKIISIYFISLLFIISGRTYLAAQDTVYIPLKVRIAAEVSGPIQYFFDKNILITEGNISVDIHEKKSLFAGAGYVDYNYSQEKYDYTVKGSFFKAGMDFNLMGPKKSQGKFFTGIGLHYGISSYRAEVPLFRTENQWGPVEASVPPTSGIAHFFEATPSVRAELFRNVSIGWNINIRVLLKNNTDSDLKMVYLPGFGDTSKKVRTGLGYFLTWNIPFRTKRVIILPPPPEEEEEMTTVPQ
ncbi:MAG TPA: DUF6048 family protein [Bacteroidales bacterium]|nr:DUF6048 family protein [Bacteroidales bacterium]